MNNTLLFGSLAAACLLFTGQAASAQGAIVNGATYKLTHYGVTSSGATPGAPAGQPLCMDVDNNLATPGVSIGQWVDNANDAQRYIFERQTDGSFKLRHKGTVMYVQTVGLSKAANTQIQQNVLVTTNDDAQRWLITDPNNNGRYKFVLKNSANAAGISQCLEVGFASDAPGARLNTYDDNGFEPAQRWVLTLTAQPSATKNANELVLSTRAYPNPFAQGQPLSVQVETVTNGPATVSVVDVLGHSVHSQEVTLKTGANTVLLHNAPLASGLYILRVAQGGNVQQTQVVQQ